MKKTILIFCALASLATAQTRTFTGIITDSMCVADHKHMNAGPDPECVKACVKNGDKYVLFEGKKMYRLSDQETPAKFSAKKVKITGTLYEKTGIIKVEKIEEVR
jgi:hypothetical protein